MSSVPSEILPGLQNPVMDAQQIFRQLLNGMSQPGSIAAIDYTVQHPMGLNPATYAVALSMLDQDTPLKLAASVNNAAARDSLHFHNSVPLVDSVSAADFVICNEVDRPDLETLNIGSDAWPDQSCTLIVQCQSFYNGITYRATGPGIQSSTKIRCSAFNDTLPHQREKLAHRFPLGIDLILTCGKEFFCIPRTTKLEAESA